MSEPTAAAAPLSTPTDDVLALAEVLGDIKTRFERLEAEHATQSAPLAAAAQALQAALAGLTALKSHVLENSIAVLSTRVEDQRRAIDEQVTSLVAELRAADQQAAQFTRSESEAIRASLAELRGHFERTAREFSARAERFDLEIKAAATRFAASPVAPGRDGASFSPAGTWSASQAGGYKRLAVVSYLGGSFVSNEDGNTEKPGPKSIKWTQLAARGPGGGSGDISGLTGVAGVTQGGTGLNSYTTGDILYASSSTTLAKLGAGAAGQFLVSNGAGTAPSWGTGTSGALPSMTGNADKILTTDGTNASWIATNAFTTAIKTTNNTSASSTSTGALVVSGGGGFGGAVYVGGLLNFASNITQAAVGTFSLANGSVISGATGGSLSLTVPSGTLNIGSANFNSGGFLVSNGNATINNGSRLILSDTTSATSTSTGAATVAGGLGVAGNVVSGGTVRTGAYTVATLLSAATYPGGLAYVTDATATTRLSTVSGGGSNKVIVYSDGTNWLIL